MHYTAKAVAALVRIQAEFPQIDWGGSFQDHGGAGLVRLRYGLLQPIRLADTVRDRVLFRCARSDASLTGAWVEERSDQRWTLVVTGPDLILRPQVCVGDMLCDLSEVERFHTGVHVQLSEIF